ncbi:MAG TPA: hypothetical protein VNE38_03960 [Ktedonobacteraceae bacterium]|nr:hypothetical protein [Ktedonobacteraceae bacterium]
MENTSEARMHSSRPGFLAEVTQALLFICDTRASGRLSLRNGEQFGITHLYFKVARLVHVTGDKHDGESMLNDLLNWTKGSVRFDTGLLVTFESLSWQQAQIFGRWLAFLEMRGIMQGIAHGRLDGLARSLMAQLPGEPIALPNEVEHYEEYEEAARARQWQRINEGVQQLVERTLSVEQREQLKQVTQQVTQHVNLAVQGVQQAGETTQDLARRASKATQDGLQRTVESVVEGAQEVTRQGTQRAGELVKQTLSRERRQHVLQSTQRTVESVAEAAQEVARQGTQRAEELLRSPLPPELQTLSIRYRSAFRSPSSATGSTSEGK